MPAKIKKKKGGRKSEKFSLSLQLDKVNWEKVDEIFAKDRYLLLQRLKKDKSKSSYTREILGLLATGAIFGLSLAFPTLPMALAPFLINRKKYQIDHFSQTVSRLQKQKLVKIEYVGSETIIKITKKGKMRALRYKVSEIAVKKPKRWDRKWRLVIFDIPENYKRVRDIFRDHLKIMGFYQLQKSVWVHPYPCFDEVEFLRQIYRVGIDVTYIVAEQIEDESRLRECFLLN